MEINRVKHKIRQLYTCELNSLVEIVSIYIFVFDMMIDVYETYISSENIFQYIIIATVTRYQLTVTYENFIEQFLNNYHKTVNNILLLSQVKLAKISKTSCLDLNPFIDLKLVQITRRTLRRTCLVYTPTTRF